jgi:tRNA dimethylallyltransferase
VVDSGVTADPLPPALFLMGPTAAGKTRLAFEICAQSNAEIVSVDSALVYRGLNIGSAKPSAAELARHPHHLVDIRDPADAYSAAEFRRDALAAMADITARGRLPLLVGGTMLYFKALIEGLAEMPVIAPGIREAIDREAESKGWPALHGDLQACDPAVAAQIHPNHSQRISRALEVFRSTGIPMSQWRADQTEAPLPYKTLQIAVAPADRIQLHLRIEERLEVMFAKGFIDEVSALYARGDLARNLPAIRAVGYRQVWEYLEGETDMQTLRERSLAATRQLAKRQYTWLRKWPDLRWIMWTNAEKSLMPEFCAHLADAGFPIHGLY